MSKTWITANQRLALYFRQQHDQTQQAQRQTVWETLDCLSLRFWMLRVYQALSHATCLVLNEQQELILWEQVIADSLDSLQSELAFLSVHSLAKTAQAAWRLLKESQTPLSLLKTPDSQEVKAFQQWAVAFEQSCHKKNVIDFSSCTEQVIAALTAKTYPLPPRIILAGFEEISAQTKQFFSVLATQCELIYHSTAKTTGNDIKRIGVGNEELELQQIAQWAYQLQQQNPNQLIGCVIPDLNAKRHQVERIFKQAFTNTHAFNISGGFPLSYFPLIQSAFDILKLGVSALDIELVSRLLSSPFLGGAEQELTARADLDVLLRETLEPQLDWQKMQFFANKQGSCSIWQMRCELYLAHYNSANSRQTAHAWGQHFAEQLQCMGWPGERTINSSEYQQMQRWYLLLEELGHLDVVLEKPLSRTQALQHLYHLTQATVFQPQTVKASVQVLGMLEAVGLPFDALWVSGMTQQNWPSPPAPNPFIPLKLQRERNMPHASAERELIYSRALTQHFCNHATTVIFSYALQKDDQLQLPSTLITHIAEIATAAWNTMPTTEQVSDNNLLEYITDDNAPPLQPHEIERGGANLFTHQAACPFRAFAQLRLGAKSLPLPVLSMSAQERGICLHAVLERVWQVLKDHHTLCQYDDAALKQLLNPIVKDVLKEIAQKRAFSLKPRFMALEQQRLTQQVMAWLALEKQRPPFRVVALESEQKVQFAGLSLTLRLDREDELLADNTRVIIDYKTGGNNKTKDWFGERPDAPQLPLYGVTCGHAVNGLAFAQISSDKLQFAGISQDETDIAGMQTIAQQKVDPSLHTWDVFLQATNTSLTGLAIEFQTGHAKVDPKELDKTCRYCDLQSLCRINFP